MIRYLNDAANNIQYQKQNGEIVTRNPFSGDFVFISQRLSLIHSNDAENQQRRKNYEDAVRNAQISVDAGRPAPPLPPVPTCIITPEDFDVPQSESTDWDPALLALKPATAPYPTSTGLRPAPATADPHPLAHIPMDVAANVVALLGTVGPAVPSLIELLQSLLHHSNTGTAK